MRKKFKTTEAEIVKMWNDDFEMTMLITPKEEPIEPEPDPLEIPTNLVLKIIVTLPEIPTNLKTEYYADN